MAMTYQDVLKLTPEELVAELKKGREKLAKLRFSHAINRLENPMQIRELRRSIARLKTAQRHHS